MGQMKKKGRQGPGYWHQEVIDEKKKQKDENHHNENDYYYYTKMMKSTTLMPGRSGHHVIFSDDESMSPKRCVPSDACNYCELLTQTSPDMVSIPAVWLISLFVGVSV